jgi:type I restriction enzyme S subunit
MKNNWPKAPLGSVLRKSERWIRIQPNDTYKLVTVRLWGKGVVLRGQVTGAEIAASEMLQVSPSQFILSRIDARNGAFGLIPNSLDGAIVSNDFPVFDIEATRLLPAFLGWMCKIRDFVDFCKAASEGTTNRVRLKEDRFLATSIPLPPLEEQRRIVAKIDELAAKIEEARTLRHLTEEEGERLLISMAHRHDLNSETKEREAWKWVSLSEVLHSIDDSHRVEAERTYSNLGIYSFGRGLFKKQPIDGALTSAMTLRRVRKGQFVYSRLFAFEGAYGMVTDDYHGFFVSNEYPTFDCDRSRMRVEFLWAHFKSPVVWKEVAVGSKGLGDRRQRVQPTQLLSYRLWLPPLEWQNRIAEVQAEVDALKSLQTETTAELDALLPSILDRAFKGEL